MEKLRIGIIGCGRISQAHIKAANYLKDDVEIVALSDKYIEKAKEVGSKIGVNFCVDDYREAFSKSKCRCSNNCPSP